MAHWKVLAEIKEKKGEGRHQEIINVLLRNRGIKTKKKIDEFFDSQLDLSKFQELVSSKDLALALKRIKKAVEKKESIVIFGDYDCDGICGTALLWETLKRLGAQVKPYIPERADGYGLSQEGIEKVRELEPRLMITVDNGITAVEAVKHASSLGIDVIITDHHLPPKELPSALAVLHSVELSGAAVAWVLATALVTDQEPLTSNLDLVALATIADLVPLIGPSRTLVKFGLGEFNQTKNVGLQALVAEAGLTFGEIGTYHLGWILGPRVNAAGRVGSAMDSLRLLCLEDTFWAQKMAQKLSGLNQKRQRLTEDIFSQALKEVEQDPLPQLIFISHSFYDEGIVGLVAAKLVEEFYRPAIVGADKGDFIKASARSIPSFDIVEAIAASQGLLEDFGGHPMAAGLTVKKENFLSLKEELEEFAKDRLKPEDLVPGYRVDCEVDLADLGWEFWRELSRFEPFGMGNRRPTFLTTGLKVTSLRAVGNSGKHLKLKLDDVATRRIEKVEADLPLSPLPFDGIGFNLGFWETRLKEGDVIDLIYNLDKNVWNGRESLQLKVKDLRKNDGD